MPSNNNSENAADFNLNRFVTAQEKLYETVVAELRNGNKQTHWMWFIFPQIDGLGTSSFAKLYAIKSISEAKAYFNHPVLGSRLLECSNIMLSIKNKSANDSLGFPDCVKLQSCMTLFSIIFPLEKVFTEVLTKYYTNEKDNRTIQLLGYA